MEAEPQGGSFGGYELESELGRGGMGIVYRARRTSDGREVALKLLLAFDSKVARERFFREAESTSRLDHPGVVPCIDFGEAGGVPFLALEYVEGGTLQDAFERGLPREELLETVIRVARALEHAHSRGVVHRDLKPANILIDREGNPRIADFGLARLLDGEGGLTRTGTSLGTPFYMAPEVAAGQSRSAGACADIYSLGVILYQGLTGRLPYEASSMASLLKKIAEVGPDPVRRWIPDIDPGLEHVVGCALERDPARRYASAERFARDLEAVARGEALGGGGSGRGRAIPFAGITLLAVLAGFLLWQSAGVAPSPPRLCVTVRPGSLLEARSGDTGVPLLFFDVEAKEGGPIWFESVTFGVEREFFGDPLALRVRLWMRAEGGDWEHVAESVQRDEPAIRFGLPALQVAARSATAFRVTVDVPAGTAPGRTLRLSLDPGTALKARSTDGRDVRVEGQVARGGTLATAGPATYVYQPGPDEGKDTHIRSWGLYLNDNFGADDTFAVGDRDTQQGDARAFIEFDLHFLPRGVRIEEAALEIWLHGNQFNTRPITLQAFVVVETRNKHGRGAFQTPWVEGTSTCDGSLDGLAWDGTFWHNPSDRPDFSQPDVDRWSDFGHGPNGILAEAVVEAAPEGWVRLDVTTAVKGWVEGRFPNFGVMLAHAEEGPPFDRGCRFFLSSDYREPALRPRLGVTVR